MIVSLDRRLNGIFKKYGFQIQIFLVLKMMMLCCLDIDRILVLILNTLVCLLRANENSKFDTIIVLICAKAQRKGLNTLLCFERAKENNALISY